MTAPTDSPPNRKRRLGTLLVAHAAATVLLGAVYLGAARHYEDILLAEARAAVEATAATHAVSLTGGLNERLALVRGLAAFVTVNATADDLGGELATFADALGRSLTGVRNISAAPDFIIRYVNPLKGNERVLGNDLLKDPRPGFAETVQRALISRDVTVHGPLQLIQGGQGIIARQVVFGPDHPWGAVGMVFDLLPILDTGRFDSLPPTLAYALRSGNGRVIAGDPAVLERAPVTEPVPLPDGQWQLALAPTEGWAAQAHQGSSFLMFNIACAMVGFLAQMVVYLVLTRRMALEGQVAQRTDDLQRTRLDLERFATAAAHAFQDPVRTVSTHAQDLARTLETADGTTSPAVTGAARGAVNGVLEGASQLKAVLRDVQLFLAEDRIPLSTAPIAVNDVLDKVLAALKGRIEAGGASVTAGPLGTVLADPRRLSEILTVLIVNAIDYHAPDRPPMVRVEARTDEEGMDVIAVTDNGIGIDEQNIERIFELFRHLDGRAGRPGSFGTGMGLPIARKMAERLGGRITVTSKPGSGSTFALHLPRHPMGSPP